MNKPILGFLLALAVLFNSMPATASWSVSTTDQSTLSAPQAQAKSEHCQRTTATTVLCADCDQQHVCDQCAHCVSACSLANHPPLQLASVRKPVPSPHACVRLPNTCAEIDRPPIQ